MKVRQAGCRNVGRKCRVLVSPSLDTSAYYGEFGNFPGRKLCHGKHQHCVARLAQPDRMQPWTAPYGGRGSALFPLAAFRPIPSQTFMQDSTCSLFEWLSRITRFLLLTNGVWLPRARPSLPSRGRPFRGNISICISPQGNIPEQLQPPLAPFFWAGRIVTRPDLVQYGHSLNEAGQIPQECCLMTSYGDG